MKIALASDLHLEFGSIVLENTEGADVLVLSGDICVVKDLNEHDDPMPTQRSQNLHDFFYDCCNKFPHVVYIMGNHEHYYYDFQYTVKDFKKRLKYLPNLQILDKETWTLFDEVTFIGGTLWTDMNREDPLTMWHIGKAMNDFRCVKNGESARFLTEDAVKEHRDMVNFIHTVTEGKYDQKFVVVGHHAPSRLSTHPRYKHEALMNGGYSSDLNEFILNHPQIKLWTHGHTHEDFDYMIGSTRVVCNPRGYIGHEGRADDFKLKYLEI